MQLKWFGRYVRKEQRYERLASLRISHSPYVMDPLITGNIHVSLYIPVILFSISSLCKYVPHILLGFLPEYTQKTTSFENLTSLHNVVLMLPFCILISSFLYFLVRNFIERYFVCSWYFAAELIMICLLPIQ